MMREDVDHIESILFATAGWKRVAQNQLFLTVVSRRIEVVFGILGEIEYRPAGESARDIGNILLRISTIDANGMEFHEFAAIVFVDTGPRHTGGQLYRQVVPQNLR